MGGGGIRTGAGSAPGTTERARPRTMRAAQARTIMGRVRANEVRPGPVVRRPRGTEASSLEHAVDASESSARFREAAPAVPAPSLRHLLGDFLRRVPPGLLLGFRFLPLGVKDREAATAGEFLRGCAFVPFFFAHALSSSVALSGCLYRHGL